MKLLTPGPVQIPRFVLDAMSKQPQFHRDEDFKSVFKEVLDKLMKLCSGTPIIIPGTGTLAVDVAVYNYVDPGSEVIAVVNGEFGERLAETLERRGCVVHRITWDLDSVPPPDVVEDALTKLKNVKAVAVVHNESSTGVVNRYIEKYQTIASAYGALLIVDSVSGLPAEPIRSNIDVIATASHKAFITPPGAAILYVSIEPRARAPVPPSMDLRRFIKFMERFETPYTPPINVMYGLNAALDYILKLGVDEYHRIHVERARFLYDSIVLKPVAREGFRSCTITAFYTHRPGDIIEALRKRGYIIASGIGKLRDRVIRIGVMGDLTLDDLKAVSEVVNSYVV